MSKALFALGLLLALCAAALAADGLLLAPGASVVVVDAAEPSSRLVLTAPQNAPLDLTPLLALQAGESVRSIVTRIQMNPAGGLTMNADGSLSLSAATLPGARAPTPGLAGGVLIYDAGKWLLRPGTAVQAVSEPVPPPPAAAQRATIYKAGATREQAERDIGQCRQYAEQAAGQQLKAADKVGAYNSTMYACLRNFGYEIRAS
jgi:hypothetical protein